MVLQIGEARFGPPSPAVRAAIGRVSDPAQLRALVEQVFVGTCWDELVAITDPPAAQGM
jgi:hypothetical protein